MNRIDGAIALVTGGTQGLGAAIARCFAHAGASGIAIVGRDQAKGEAVAACITQETGIPVLMIAADLSDPQTPARIVKEARARFGRVDILVNAAALTDRGTILSTDVALFDAIFATNVRAPFFLMQEVVRQMIDQGIEGRIVNIGSTSEHAGQPNLSAYSTSKGALATLTRNTAFALMRNRIRVNQLDIGWMASDHERALQIAETGDPDWEVKARANLPFGRLVDPEEVARAALYLASPDSGLMSGAVIHFDQSVWGGYDGQAPVPAQPLQ
ncbi:SDR family oxidoreductase [Thioclava kandeliae]|uniref:SDR family oxidoreductase n=1 Tax=Thioclava kandeliae TaxID=3070818 RepID=A0ABV1SKU5_9RHOB